MTQPKVKLYGLSTCAACKQTSKFFDENNVEYEKVFLDTLDDEAKAKAASQVKMINPAFSFPTIEVGYKVIVGFREEMIKQALKGL